MEVKFEDGKEKSIYGKARVAELQDGKTCVSFFKKEGLIKIVNRTHHLDGDWQATLETDALLAIADAIREELKKG